MRMTVDVPSTDYQPGDTLPGVGARVIGVEQVEAGTRLTIELPPAAVALLELDDGPVALLGSDVRLAGPDREVRLSAHVHARD